MPYCWTKRKNDYPICLCAQSKIQFHDAGSPNVWLPDYKCREITREEIKEFVDAYAQSALLCKNAGVDGVEVHAVHEGYLMDQFTLPYSNHRIDEYGGSFENRYRFAVEVVQYIAGIP